MSEAISQEELKAGGNLMTEDWNHLKVYSLICLVPVMG